MLTSLFVKNFALIEEIRIEFTPGLTVMTGETGAGKSIVIDALSLVLGERADTSMIRQGNDKAVVEAEFDAETLDFLRERVESIGAEWQPVLILRREVSSKGVSRAFVNDTPVPVAELREFGNRLVDIHGQHDHQSLLRTETHRTVLDSDVDVRCALDDYRAVHTEFIQAIDELRSMRETRDRIDERRLVAEHQLGEIDTVNPVAEEDDSIEHELRVLEHAEKLATMTNESLELLFDGEHNAVDMLGRCVKLLDDLSRIDAVFSPLRSEVETTAGALSEIARSLRDYLDSIDVTPTRAEQLRHRLAEILALTRRFRLPLPEILEKREKLRDELASLENIDDRIAEAEQRVERLREECSSAAGVLTHARERAGDALATLVVGKLRDLGIGNAMFRIRLHALPANDRDNSPYLVEGSDRRGCTDYGWEDVEFFLSTNVGEDPKPLIKVVSGGEVSRIMLALKSIFADRDHIPIMVFDEIDVGVSGHIARKVGHAMRRLADKHQIVTITHLPQIAGIGHTHLLVRKRSSKGRTITDVRRLDYKERIHEIARLLSGDAVTDASVKSAMELLEPGQY